MQCGPHAVWEWWDSRECQQEKAGPGNGCRLQGTPGHLCTRLTPPLYRCQ